MLSPDYTHRFVVNREPQLTPYMLRLVTRTPLRLSSQMLADVDDLQLMIQALEQGKPVDKQDAAVKIADIRSLAKAISKSTDWDYVDQRKQQDILKGVQIDGLNPDGIVKLREVVTDLHTQLSNWYSSSSTSTISASTLMQPSIGSLTKGIEKLSKAMEDSLRKM